MSIEIRPGRFFDNVRYLVFNGDQACVHDALAAEIERLQACERALAIAEKALRRIESDDLPTTSEVDALISGEAALCGCVNDYEGGFVPCFSHSALGVAHDALTAIEAAKAGQG